MQPTKNPPSNYRPVRQFSIQPKPVLLMLNVVGLLLLVVSAYLYVRLFIAIRPQDAAQALEYNARGLLGVLLPVIVIILVTIVMLVLHEGIHGLFFWVFTRDRPVFAFKGYYASASAPGWYIPRNPYLVVGLAPLVFITLLCCLLLPFIPPGWFLPLLLLVSMNASGAVGDLWMTIGLMRYPAYALAFDEADRMTVFMPEPQNE